MTTEEASHKDAPAPSKKQIQLKKLPTLHAEPHDSLEQPMHKILSQAVAIRLKPMNKDVAMSQFAFENLVQLVGENLSFMLTTLHRFVDIQRRREISKKDLLLLLKGYDLSNSELMRELESSQYIVSNHPEEVKEIAQKSKELKGKLLKPMTEKELLNSAHSEFFFKDMDILDLVPPTNKNNQYIPKWLPEFPPDHTYRFTSQYNKPVVDERQLRRKLVEEGKQSERALVNLLKHHDSTNQDLGNNERVEKRSLYEETQEETFLIFGPERKKSHTTENSHELLRTLPLKNFSVEEYARNRVEIARRKVSEYEQYQLRLQKNPFIKAANLCSPLKKSTMSRKAIDKELKSMLQRSYIGLLRSVPKLNEVKGRERELANERRREMLEKLNEERQRQAEAGGGDEVLDLNNLNEDPLLAGFDSSDSEGEDGEAKALARNTQHTELEQVEPSQTKSSQEQEQTLFEEGEDKRQSQSQSQSQQPYVSPFQTQQAGTLLQSSSEAHTTNPSPQLATVVKTQSEASIPDVSSDYQDGPGAATTAQPKPSNQELSDDDDDENDEGGYLFEDVVTNDDSIVF